MPEGPDIYCSLCRELLSLHQIATCLAPFQISVQMLPHLKGVLL